MLQTLALKRGLEVCSPLSLSMSDTKPNCFKSNGAAVVSYFHFAKSFVTCWEKNSQHGEQIIEYINNGYGYKSHGQMIFERHIEQ